MSDALRSALSGIGAAEAERSIRAGLRLAAVLLGERLGLPSQSLEEARLFANGGGEPRTELDADLGQAVAAYVEAGFGETSVRQADAGAGDEHRRCAHLLGELLNDLLAVWMELEGDAPGQPSVRRRSGSFFTPRAVCATVVREALGPLLAGGVESLEPRPFRICDPAVGGGAFLVEACVVLEERYRSSGLPAEVARRRAVRQVCGVDRSELAVAVAELALWLYLADPGVSPSFLRRNVVQGDALCGAPWSPALGSTGSTSHPPLVPDPPADGLELHWHVAFPEVAGTGFDVVVGNPPWVAFAGRSAQRLAPGWRAYFRSRYRSFAGFPTLHGLFVQRAAELAPRGRIALLLPSALADLDGYRATREVLGLSHRVVAPLTELGQDVFEGVVQPSFVLVADARAEGDVDRSSPGAPWVLRERTRSAVELTFAPPPTVLTEFGGLPVLPPGAFREMGFQSNRQVSSRLFLRAPKAREPYSVPLLEGRTVKEFRVDPPRVFLWADQAELSEAGVRLRSPSEYAAVDFVVRQTAAVTIAARHTGMAFRNSLLAGYGVDTLDADLLVGLLNSSLFRALHLSRQRDARQAVFPQVKIAHLRGLPMPPENDDWRDRVRSLSARATALRECSHELRAELDRATARLFGLGDREREAVERFLRERVGRNSVRVGSTQVAAAPHPPASSPVASAQEETLEGECPEGSFVEPRGIEPLTS